MPLPRYAHPFLTTITEIGCSETHTPTNKIRVTYLVEQINPSKCSDAMERLASSTAYVNWSCCNFILKSGPCVPSCDRQPGINLDELKKQFGEVPPRIHPSKDYFLLQLALHPNKHTIIQRLHGRNTRISAHSSLLAR